MPDVSIIMPYYNLDKYTDGRMEELLNDSVGSIINQTFPNWELIVVDHHSNEKSSILKLAELQKHPQINVIQSYQKYSLPAARNYGISNSSGEFICCLDADDKYSETFVEETVATLEKNNKLGFVTSWFQTFESENADIKPSKNNSELLTKNIPYVASMFRRKVWEKSKYDENLSAYQDWDFWLSAVENGFDWEVIQKVLFYYRVRGGSMISNSRLKDDRLYDYIIHKHKSLLMSDEEAQIRALKSARKTIINYDQTLSQVSYQLKENKLRLEAIENSRLWRIRNVIRRIIGSSIPSKTKAGALEIQSNSKPLTKVELLLEYFLKVLNFNRVIVVDSSDITLAPQYFYDHVDKEAIKGLHSQRKEYSVGYLNLESSNIDSEGVMQYIELMSSLPVYVIILDSTSADLSEIDRSNIFVGNGDQNQLVIIGGQIIEYKLPKKQVSVLAIINVFNEKDIIGQVTKYLIEDQDIDVYVTDNWSSDGTYELLQTLQKKYKNRLQLGERYGAKGKYQWGELLAHTSQIAYESGYDWCMHYDADELRESPWKGVNLKNAISFVDEQGFSAIDFTVFDFVPTKDGFGETDDPKEFFSHGEFGTRPGHFKQIKAWKNVIEVDLTQEGGHEALFEGRKVFPLKFLLRHYPLRSNKQGQFKIRKGRLDRIPDNEKAWNIQYVNMENKTNFIREEQELIHFGSGFETEYLIERISGVGLGNK